jgi:Icc-related predicted phosphoesterase
MVRIAAVSDLHFTVEDEGKVAERMAGVAERADLLLLPGDLTDNGSVEAARLLGKELEPLGLPILAVLGNHDCAARQPEALISALSDVGVIVLDGESAVIRARGLEVGVAGVKGFQGGFDENALADYTEPETEAWIITAKEEAAKLDAALGNLSTDLTIAMLHYAPIRDTIVGQNPETFAFYGSSHLLKPIERHRPDLVVHGHSHRGTHSGRTPGGIPVYNVAVKVINVPFVVLEIGQ